MLRNRQVANKEGQNQSQLVQEQKDAQGSYAQQETDSELTGDKERQKNRKKLRNGARNREISSKWIPPLSS